MKKTKQMTITRLPEMLIVSMSRFSPQSKIAKNVSFPIKGLDMSKHVPKEVLDQDTPGNSHPTMKGKSTLYDLVGVSHHSGGLGGGHYTADARLFEDEKGNSEWAHLNDSSGSYCSSTSTQKSTAYVLFYQRRQEP